MPSLASATPPDGEIRRLLEQRLYAMPGLPVAGGRPAVQGENQTLDLSYTGPWLRLALQPVGSSRYTLGSGSGSSYRDDGNLLVDCFSPVNAGPHVADVLAAAVRGWFLTTPHLSAPTVDVTVTDADRAGGRAGSPEDPPGYFVPVTVTWVAFWTLA